MQFATRHSNHTLDIAESYAINIILQYTISHSVAFSWSSANYPDFSLNIFFDRWNDIQLDVISVYFLSFARLVPSTVVGDCIAIIREIVFTIFAIYA